jgi:uncharacterized protein (TIRG00374 family)
LNVLIDVIYNIDLRWIFVAGLLFFIGHLIIIYRLKYILKKFHKVSYKDLFWFHFFGYAIGQLTPGKLGYFSVAYLLKKQKIPYSFSTSVLIFAQFMSLVVQLILAGFGILYLILMKGVTLESIVYFILGLGWLLGLSIGIFLFFKHGPSKLKFIKRFPYGEKIFGLMGKLDRDFSKVKPMIPKIFIISLFLWLMSGLAWAAIGTSLGINIPIISYTVLNPLITSLTFIPISPSGMGFAEGGSVLIFSFLGVQMEKAFLLMILDRSINLFLSTLGLKIFFSKK